MTRRWTEGEIEFLDDQYLRVSVAEMAAVLGRSRAAVASALWRFGIVEAHTRPRRRPCVEAEAVTFSEPEREPDVVAVEPEPEPEPVLEPEPVPEPEPEEEIDVRGIGAEMHAYLEYAGPQSPRGIAEDLGLPTRHVERVLQQAWFTPVGQGRYDVARRR